MALSDFKVLQDEVERNDTVDGSAVTLLNQLSAMLSANKDDPAEIQRIANRLKNSSDALAAAILANTPQAPGGGGETGGGETGGGETGGGETGGEAGGGSVTPPGSNG